MAGEWPDPERLTCLKQPQLSPRPQRRPRSIPLTARVRVPCAEAVVSQAKDRRSGEGQAGCPSWPGRHCCASSPS